MNESKAIEMCLKDKDPIGFEFLVEQYKREAYYHALSFTNSKEDAADACQDAFRKAFAAMPRLASLDNFYPWFYRILKNHCINMSARKRTANKYRQATIDGEIPQADSENPSEELVNKETRESIHEVLETLNPTFKEILTLKYFGDKSYEEIAELLEIPRGTVMSRLFHARSAFRDAFNAAEKSFPN
ncbi:MAG: RNA polymerase sigma factor [Verrucomicrobia bacterium]|nr:RNA polymerase sigma factor [Verrucomicrobiota bacterium]MDA1066870.1 RNA polymerase sigma factor [Verrucomicrobiota bacterium]